MKTLLDVRDLTFTYPGQERPALDGVSFTMGEGAFVLLCGASGSGKTSLLRLLKRETAPVGTVSGEVRLLGQPVQDLSPRDSARLVGLVRQDPEDQIVTDRVWHELAFGLENLGTPPAEIRRRTAEMASFFGIGSWYRRGTDQLSGGQKQILSLASVMAMGPRLLLLDEPTSQLDPVAARNFLQAIFRVNRELGTAVLISEHRLGGLFEMADQVLVLDRGRKQAFVPPGQMSDAVSGTAMEAALPDTARICGACAAAWGESMNDLPYTIRTGRVWLGKRLGEPGAPGAVPAAIPDAAPAAGAALGEEGARPAIEARGLTFWYPGGRPVLEGLDLRAEKGKIYGLLGGNGAGKTTFLRLVLGLEKPEKGKIQVTGRTLAVPQDPLSLFTEISVEEELAEALVYEKLADEEKVRRIEEMLREMDLMGLRKVHPYDLSGGERQRLALAKVLLLEPEVLLLDEPVKGLDSFFKGRLSGDLRRLAASGMTILLVTHDLAFCARTADRCALLFDGAAVGEADTRTFFRSSRFYTTEASLLVRDWFPDVLTWEEAADHAVRAVSAQENAGESSHE